MVKKWIAILLVCVIALSLCACGKDESKKQDDNQQTGSQPTTNGNDDHSGGAILGNKVNAAVLTQMLMTQTDYDGQISNMKGTVEYDAEYNIIASKTYVNDQLVFEATYDKVPDKVLTEKSYDEDGVCYDETQYTYDANGNCLVRLSIFDYDGGKGTTKDVSTYDEQGNLLTEEYYNGDELVYRYVYTYTASGKVATDASTWNDGEEQMSTYTYDEYDNVLSITIQSNMYDTLIKEYENTYENGKLTTVAVYADGELDVYTQFDADGNEILSVSYMAGEEFFREQSVYTNGRLVKYTCFDNGEESYSQEYTYNDNGILVRQSMTYSDGESQYTEYAYSEMGDVVSLKVYEGDELTTECTLSYQNVEVSEELAEKIQKLNALLVDI